MSEILWSCGSNLEEFSLLEYDTVWISRNKCTSVLEECAASIFNTLRTGLLNCLNASSRGLIQSEVRFL